MQATHGWFIVVGCLTYALYQSVKSDSTLSFALFELSYSCRQRDNIVLKFPRAAIIARNVNAKCQRG